MYGVTNSIAFQAILDLISESEEVSNELAKSLVKAI
jgi:hypothetical protein